MGLAETLEFLRRRPLAAPAAMVAVLVLWNSQFASIYNSEVVGPKNQAVSLDRLIGAQVDLVYRRLLKATWLPPRIWAVLYDNVKGVWLSDGPRSLGGRIDLGREPEDLHYLVGEGWFEPEAEEGVHFRRSRGPRSVLQLPILRREDYRALFRARLEHRELEVEMSLKVNDEPRGSVRLQPGWQEYTFLIPANVLRVGLNKIQLNYSTTPRQSLSDYDGRNAVIALDYVQFERVPSGIDAATRIVTNIR
jgi:hypothetical protein